MTVRPNTGCRQGRDYVPVTFEAHRLDLPEPDRWAEAP
jgi:hypothetical protein